jgi:hypothetical protein
MSDTTRTVDEMIGDLHRKIEGLKAQNKAFTEPNKEKIKEMERQIGRLLLEDGGQMVNENLLEVVDVE